MNLPSSLANPEPSKDHLVDLYNAPALHRKSSIRSNKSVKGKARQNSNTPPPATDDRGGDKQTSASLQRPPLVQKQWTDSLSTPGTPQYDESVPLAVLTRSKPGTSDVALTVSSRQTGGTGDDDDGDDPNESASRSQKAWRSTKTVLRRHCAFVGPGIIASVGYTDPGNWVTDLAAGSQYGYKLLFTVLLSGLFGIFLQILAVRMGVVTGHDLARNTRLLLLPDDDARVRGRTSGTDAKDKPDPIRHRMLRVGTLWVLYLVSEAALIATELAELLGSAIALNLLFPGLPLYGGVLVTCADVMLILFVYQPQGNFRIFEALIAVLVLAVLGCYVVLLVRVEPDWADVFHGYVPSSTLVLPGALYTSIGIVGAVIMPHALYLGSHFSTINRLDRSKNADAYEEDAERALGLAQKLAWHQRLTTSARQKVLQCMPGARRRAQQQQSPVGTPPASSDGPHFSGLARVTTSEAAAAMAASDARSTHRRPMRMSIAEIKLHLPHCAWDIALSLLFFAITVNSAILIVAGAAFYYGGSGSRELSDLYDAFNLLRDTLGRSYAILFAVALLCAGQSASITCTLAGQIVSEGFIRWRTNAFVRRLVTRVITVVPSLAIAIGVGRSGLDEMLIGSQVALSFALPFVLVPLIMVTSMRRKMRIEDDVDQEAGEVVDEGSGRAGCGVASPRSADAMLDEQQRKKSEITAPAVEDDLTTANVAAPEPSSSSSPTSAPTTIMHDFTNHWFVKGFAGVIYLVILLADVYTLVTTIRGEH